LVVHQSPFMFVHNDGRCGVRHTDTAHPLPNARVPNEPHYFLGEVNELTS
jgi:hypothetical protein